MTGSPRQTRGVEVPASPPGSSASTASGGGRRASRAARRSEPGRADAGVGVRLRELLERVRERLEVALDLVGRGGGECVERLRLVLQADVAVAGGNDARSSTRATRAGRSSPSTRSSASGRGRSRRPTPMSSPSTSMVEAAAVDVVVSRRRRVFLLPHARRARAALRAPIRPSSATQVFLLPESARDRTPPRARTTQARRMTVIPSRTERTPARCADRRRRAR